MAQILHKACIAAATLALVSVTGAGVPTAGGRLAVAVALRAKEDERWDVEQSLAALAEIRPLPIAELIDLYGRDRVPSSWMEQEAYELVLSPLHQAVLLDALRALPYAEVAGHLHRLEESYPDPHRRPALLRLVGSIGLAGELSLSARLAIPGDSDELTEAIKKAYEACVSGLLLRDARTLVAARTVFASLDRRLVGSTLGCIENAPLAGRFECLSDLLGSIREADPLVLRALIGAAHRMQPPYATGACLKVRGLVSEFEPRRTVLATQALGALEDYGAIPLLLDCLGAAEPNVRAAAAEALRDITGQEHRQNADLWSAWYLAEQNWWKVEAGEAFATLRQGNPTEAIEVLRGLTGRGLYRHELAEEVSAGLEREEPEVIVLVCGLLKRLGSRAAVEPLRRLLAYGELQDSVRAAVSATLGALTPYGAEREVQ